MLGRRTRRLSARRVRRWYLVAPVLLALVAVGLVARPFPTGDRQASVFVVCAAG